MAKRGFLAYGRPLSYASELGEAVRPLISPVFVKALYGISIVYIMTDVGFKLYEYPKNNVQPLMFKTLDLCLWHMSASLIVPAVIIHSTVKFSNKIIKRATKNRPKLAMRTRLLPSLIGLASIPFIIHPIDKTTDYVLDRTLRKCYEILNVKNMSLGKQG